MQFYDFEFGPGFTCTVQAPVQSQSPDLDAASIYTAGAHHWS